MAAKNSLTQTMAQLADDVLFGARVLYRELDDIFGHVSGRLPRETKQRGIVVCAHAHRAETVGPG
jgi:hypothetical protein